MIYLLDSDAVAALVTPQRKSHKIFMTHAQRLQKTDRFCISILTIYEIEYSIHSFTDEQKKNETIKSLSALKKSLDIFTLNVDDATIYGRLKAGYKQYTGIQRKAIRKHNLDIALASLAISRDATIISGDGIYLTLQKVDGGLKYENWLV